MLNARYIEVVRAALAAYAEGDTSCEHRTMGQTCGACEGCDARRFSDASAAFDSLIAEAHGGLAAGRRAARTARELTQELLHVERALLPLTEDDTEAGERSPGEAVEHFVWQHSEACESERMLLEQVRDARREMSDQQAIHETEMEQDGRARAMMVALCRDLGVSIYTDATRGIRNEMHRRKALLRRCFDWWGQDDVGRLVYADLCRFFGVPADDPGICSTGLTAEPVDSGLSNPGDLQDTERSS